MVKRIWKIILKILKYLVFSLGVIALLMIIFSFTDQPYNAYYKLGTYHAEIESDPNYIILMGAGGMPGPEGLMRCNYAARAALNFPEARIIIAMPSEAKDFKNSDAWRMFEELNRWGIGEERVLFETRGTNTYYQAREIKSMLSNENSANLLVVSSPEHMYRCIKTFEKLGFDHVYGLPTFEAYFDEDLLVSPSERNKLFRNPDRSVDLRYNMWTYLKYEITVIREGIAIVWYKIRRYI
ncbi:MAG: YdcF family protein [Bacteroidales bacterium]|nr:YdcF family protein [Bacteroidales bacterium]